MYVASVGHGLPVSYTPMFVDWNCFSKKICKLLINVWKYNVSLFFFSRTLFLGVFHLAFWGREVLLIVIFQICLRLCFFFLLEIKIETQLSHVFLLAQPQLCECPKWENVELPCSNTVMDLRKWKRGQCRVHVCVCRWTAVKCVAVIIRQACTVLPSYGAAFSGDWRLSVEVRARPQALQSLFSVEISFSVWVVYWCFWRLSVHCDLELCEACCSRGQDIDKGFWASGNL